MSRQFQFRHGNFNFITAISTWSRQYQFHHSNFNFVTAISISPRQFQLRSRQFQFQFHYGNFNFIHGNFNFTTAISTSFTAISILSPQFFSTCLRTGNSRLGFQRPIAIWVITHNADGAHCLWRDFLWRSILIELWRDVLWTLWFVHNEFTTVLYTLWIR